MFQVTEDYNKDKLSLAKMFLIMQRPFLATAFLALPIKVVETEEGHPIHNTACVTDKGVVYISKFLIDRADCSEQMLGAIHLHEVSHVIRRHLARRKNFLGDTCTEEILKDWNAVADLEINDDSIIEQYDKECLTVSTIEAQWSKILGRTVELKGMLAEEIYVLMQEVKKKQPQAQPKGGRGGQSCGSGSGGQKVPGEPNGQGQGKEQGQNGGSLPGGEGDSPDGFQGNAPADSQADSQGLTEAELNLLAEDVAKKIQQATAKNGGKPPGNVPGSWARWADKVLEPPKVKWERELSIVIRRAISTMAGRSHFTMKTLNRRQSAFPGVRMSGQDKPVVEVLSIIDTSGSMNNGDISLMLGEVQGILKAVGQPCWVLSVDAQVHTRQRVVDAKQVKAKGGGGTDMRVGVREAMRLKPKPHVIVILTDGYTPWPNEEDSKGAIVIAVITPGGCARNVPGHIKVIQVN